MKDTKDVLSIQQFVHLAGEGRAGVPEAIALLEASRASLEHLPLKKRREKAATAGASQILRWLLGTDSKQWDVTITRELVEPLCWHLEAEGRSGAVQTWLEIWANDSSLRRDAVKAQSFRTSKEWNKDRPNAKSCWPGTVLAGMVEAKIYWFPNDAGPAFELALSVHDAARYHVFFGYALTPLLRAVVANQALPCETHLFSRFQQMLRDLMRSPIHYDQCLARLLLAHPVSPDPQGALRFIQNEQYTTAARCWRDKAKLSVSLVALKAAYICFLRGERDNATFLRDWSVKLRQRPLKRYSFLCRKYRKDPKLKDLHERAAMKGVDYRTIAKDMAA